MQDSEKKTHAAVSYENDSQHGERACWRCTMYQGKKETADGKPGCSDVQRPIYPGGWCRIFDDAFRELK